MAAAAFRYERCGTSPGRQSREISSFVQNAGDGLLSIGRGNCIAVAGRQIVCRTGHTHRGQGSEDLGVRNRSRTRRPWLRRCLGAFLPLRISNSTLVALLQTLVALRGYCAVVYKHVRCPSSRPMPRTPSHVNHSPCLSDVPRAPPSFSDSP